MERRIKMHDLNLGLAKEPFGIVKDHDTIRAEALREAADRAWNFLKVNPYCYRWNEKELRAAITQELPSGD